MFENVEHVKHGVDVLNLWLVVAACMDAVPHITAFLSLIWIALRIYETKTVQRWVRRNHSDRRID